MAITAINGSEKNRSANTTLRPSVGEEWSIRLLLVGNEAAFQGGTNAQVEDSNGVRVSNQSKYILTHDYYLILKQGSGLDDNRYRYQYTGYKRTVT